MQVHAGNLKKSWRITLTWTERAPSRILQPQDTGPALAFSADAPRAPSQPRPGILGLSVLLAGVVAKCVCVMQRWAVWSYRLVAGSCQRTSGIGRTSKSFARACWLWQRGHGLCGTKDRLLSGISEILGQLQDVCNGKPLALTSDTRCPRVMQSCSVCSRKVFGCRRSDSFPENDLLASHLPVRNFLIFQFMRALMIGNVTQMLWLLARHLNEQPLRGFYVHHWDENIANSKNQLCLWFLISVLEIQNIPRLLDPMILCSERFYKKVYLLINCDIPWTSPSSHHFWTPTNRQNRQTNLTVGWKTLCRSSIRRLAPLRDFLGRKKSLGLWKDLEGCQTASVEKQIPFLDVFNMNLWTLRCFFFRCSNNSEPIWRIALELWIGLVFELNWPVGTWNGEIAIAAMS